VKAIIGALGLAIFLTAGSPSLSAQWPPYRTPGIPRTASGEADLAAPAPRTADGKPDLSGLWRAGQAPGLPRVTDTQEPGDPPFANFGNIATGMKDGLPLQPWAAELLKKRQAGNSKDNPEANCLPMGIMQSHTQGYPRKFFQSPTLLLITYEAWHNFRQIYTDGRSLPPPSDDLQPQWYGYSIGRWDGDTLVAETTGFRDDGWLDIAGNPMTSAAKVTERFNRVNFGRMDIDVTIDDPKAYTRPWTVRVRQRLLVDQEMMEMICAENMKFFASEGIHKP
jgi:hypothetical protein